MANRDYISNITGWTFDEFEEAASRMPENVGFMEGMVYRDFLKMLLTPTMSSFVDYQNKTVDFQNEEMTKYLQMAKKYGVERIAEDEGTTKYFDGDTLREDGAGAAIKPYLSMGIVASGKYKDLAWDFLRSFLAFTGDQEFSDIGFPINRQVFEKECAATMTHKNDLYDKLHSEEEEGHWDEEYLNSLVRFTEQDLDDLKMMIESANTTLSYDAAMLDVITEEAAAYFAGDRSEEDVLKNIQNRCQLIVNERG